MVLDAYGIHATTGQLRAAANQLQGTTSYDQGVSLDVLQAIGQEAGLTAEGLIGDNGKYRQWSIADLIGEARRGYPVITLVRYATLPDHAGSKSTSDHYVVVIGVNGQGLVINDPAFEGNGGFRRQLSPDALMNAWRAASIPQQAVAFLPPAGKPSLAMLNARIGQLGQGSSSAAASPISETSLPAPPLQLQPARVAPGAPSPTSSATAESANTVAPPPGPATARWESSLSQWRHSSPPDAPVSATNPRAASPRPGVATPPSDPGLPFPAVPLPIAVVIALVGMGTVLILTQPGPGPE